MYATFQPRILRLGQYPKLLWLALPHTSYAKGFTVKYN